MAYVLLFIKNIDTIDTINFAERCYIKMCFKKTCQLNRVDHIQITF